MEESGGEWIRPGGPNVSARGIDHVIVLRPGLIGSRWCEPGTIVKVDRVTQAISPPDDRLDEAHADILIKHGRVKAHKLKPGEKVTDVVSVKPRPLPTAAEHAALEAATDPSPRMAERAITGRQKAGAI